MEPTPAKHAVTNVSVSTDGKPLQAASAVPLAEPALVPRTNPAYKETEKEAVLPGSARQPLPRQDQQTKSSAPAAPAIPDKKAQPAPLLAKALGCSRKSCGDRVATVQEAHAVTGISEPQTEAHAATAPAQETKTAPAGRVATGQLPSKLDLPLRCFGFLPGDCESKPPRCTSRCCHRHQSPEDVEVDVLLFALTASNRLSEQRRSQRSGEQQLLCLISCHHKAAALYHSFVPPVLGCSRPSVLEN